MKVRRTIRAIVRLSVVPFTAMVCAAVAGAAPDAPATAAGPAPADEKSAFTAAARIFEARCARCHGGKDPEMRMSLERGSIYRSTVNVQAVSQPGVRVVPGDPGQSLLYRKLLPSSQGHYRGPRMPMGGAKLDEADLATIRAWIESFPTETWGPPPGGAPRTAGGAAGTPADRAQEAAGGAASEVRPGAVEADSAQRVAAEADSAQRGAAEADSAQRGAAEADSAQRGATEAGSAHASAPSVPRIFTTVFDDRFLAHLPGPDTLGSEVLEFRFAHRFKAGTVQAGADNLWGLDTGAWVSLGLAYGITDWLDVGLRRTNQYQDYEAYSKAALVRQASGGAPLSLSVFGSLIRIDQSGIENPDRWSVQLVLGRRFNEWLSFALVPTYAARTNYLDPEDTRGTSAIGVEAEARLSSSIALTGEWIDQVGGVEAQYQTGSLGLLIHTSKHTFNLLLTNAPGSHTDIYAPGGDLDWQSGDFRLGFNISRIWDLGRKPR